MAAEACPSIRCTALTLAPALIASEAAVCRSSCGVSPGSPMTRAAASNQADRAFRLRSTAPCGEGKASSSKYFVIDGKCWWLLEAQLDPGRDAEQKRYGFSTAVILTSLRV